MTSIRASWSSRRTFLLATIGGAVGLGNLWRFPFIAGENGGGGFVLIYLGFVLLLGLPVLAGEMLLGKRGHKSAVQSVKDLVQSEQAHPAWNAIGLLSILIPFIALGYYSVVAAWSLDYLLLAVKDTFTGFTAASSSARFEGELKRSVFQAFLHATFVAATAWAIARGLNKGIEALSRIIMPALFLMLLAMVAYGWVAGDMSAAMTFLFAPDFSAITGRSVLIALGQALFSVGIAAGLMITYSSYMPKTYSLRTSATIVCLGDTLVAILAGLAIFPIVFASGLDAAEGPGLLFVTLPIAFGSMPGGYLMGILFFLLLLFAAYTTALAMLEPTVAWLEERFPGKRKAVTSVMAAITWIMGLGSVLSFSELQDVYPLKFLGIERNWFDLADFTVANIMLPLNAFLIAAFCGWAIRRQTVAEEFADDPSLWRRWWRFSNRYLAPLAIGIVLIDLLRS